MNFALSVSLLAQALSRTTDPGGTPQTTPALLKTLNADEVLTLTLDLEGLNPTQLTVTQLAINGDDRRDELSQQSWTTTNSHITAPGSVSYQVIQAGEDAPLLISAIFTEADAPPPPPPPPAQWNLQNTAQGAFEILASVANGTAPSLTNQADGNMLIHA